LVSEQRLADGFDSKSTADVAACLADALEELHRLQRSLDRFWTGVASANPRAVGECSPAFEGMTIKASMEPQHWPE
jgi:hypothetical protein